MDGNFCSTSLSKAEVLGGKDHPSCGSDCSWGSCTCSIVVRCGNFTGIAIGINSPRKPRNSKFQTIVTLDTEQYFNAFAVEGPQAWNSLLPALCLTSKSFSNFKENFNRFFLDCHFVRDNVHIDCVQQSSNSSYHILHCTSCRNCITLQYNAQAFACVYVRNSKK